MIELASLSYILLATHDGSNFGEGVNKVSQVS